MTYKKFLTAVMCAFFFGLIWGLGVYHFAWKDAMNQLPEPPYYAKSIENLNEEFAKINIDVLILKGEMKSITERYNDYGTRLRIIENKMRIFIKE